MIEWIRKRYAQGRLWYGYCRHWENGVLWSLWQGLRNSGIPTPPNVRNMAEIYFRRRRGG